MNFGWRRLRGNLLAPSYLEGVPFKWFYSIIFSAMKNTIMDGGHLEDGDHVINEGRIMDGGHLFSGEISNDTEGILSRIKKAMEGVDQ